MNERDMQPYFDLEREEIDRYIEQLQQERSADTVRRYRQFLDELYNFLPEDKRIYKDTLPLFLASLRKRYSVSTMNVSISISNSFMRFLGRKEFQLDRMSTEPTESPKLTRDEYFRLLTAARVMGQRRSYLLVKLFGNTVFPVHNMQALTVEAIQANPVCVNKMAIWIPDLLRQELLDYAKSEDICTGPIFRTKSGAALDRVRVFHQISNLSDMAGVAKEKANPKCLRDLHKRMIDEVRQKLEPMVEQSYVNRLEAEENLVFWTDGSFGSALLHSEQAN